MPASRSAAETGPDLMNCGRLPTTERTFMGAEATMARRCVRLLGPLAQLVEQGTLNPKVAGSIPARPITKTLEAAPFRRSGVVGGRGRGQQTGQHFAATVRPTMMWAWIGRQ